MRRSILLALLAPLALPAAAPAAPAKISPRAPAVSPAGVAAVEAANPNTYVLRGTATVTVARRTVARRNVRLGARSVVTIGLRFRAPSMAALRSAGGRATLTLRVRGAGRRPTTARRKLTFRLPSGAPSAPAAPSMPSGAPAGPPPVPSATAPGDAGTPAGPAPASPASDRWIGRMGDEGAYDDLELTLAGGQVQITKPPTVPVFCFENGGGYRNALSFELFDAPGPWTLGTDGNVVKQGIAVNQLVSSGARSITYKVTQTAQAPGRLTGTLGMSFFDSKYDIFTNRIAFINCSGGQSFEAVPAG